MIKNILILLFMIGLASHVAQGADFDAIDVELETELEALMDGKEVIHDDVLEPEVFNHKAGEKVNKAPEPFEDSTIKRKLKNGKTQEFDGDKYMIVRRRKYTKEKPKTIIKEKKVVKYKNRISLLGGRAPDGDISQENGKIFTEHDAALGLQYQRLLNERLSIGIQVQTNESVFGSIGYDF